MSMFGVVIILSSQELKKILDTEGRVDRFMKKYGMGSANTASTKGQKAEKDSNK
jgi:large subunit ribosomal protein L31